MTALTPLGSERYALPPPESVSSRFILVTGDSTYFPDVRHIFEHNIRPLYGDQESVLSQLAERNGKRCKILVHNQEVVCLVAYKNSPQSEFEEFGINLNFEVKTVYIKFKNPTLESRLFQEITQAAQRRGANHITVTVSENAPDSKELLTKWGFQTIHTWNGRYLPGVKEYLFTSSTQTLAQRITGTQMAISPEKRKRKREHEGEFADSRPEKKAKISHNPYSEKPIFASTRPAHQSPSYNPNMPPPVRPKATLVSYRPLPTPPSRTPRGRTAFRLSRDCHQLTLRNHYIHQIQNGQKTIEGRIDSFPVTQYRVGDKVRFFYKQNEDDDAICRITSIKRFSSFREMLEKTDFKACIPDARTLEEAVRIYDSIPGYREKAARFGVVAISILANDDARREFINNTKT